MRTQRLGLIQTPDQLRFSYIAILHGADRVLKGDEDEDEDSLSDEGVASEDSGEEDVSAEKRKSSGDQMPPPLPPRQSDSRKEENIVTEVRQMDKPPPVLKRTYSLSGSSSPSVTPEPPSIPPRDEMPPPIPPRDKTMYSDDHFLGEREGSPSPKDIPLTNVEGSAHLGAENALIENSMTVESTLNR